MSANDRYNSQSQSYRPHPMFQEESSSYSTPPAYTSTPSYSTTTAYLSNGQVVSPFDESCDDHVYPARSQYRDQSSASSMYGQGSRIDNIGESRDDIPLKEQRKSTTDHVYDETEVTPAGKRRAKEVPSHNFFGMTAGRIPWVVYTLTIVQTAVFIAEIVKSSQLTGLPIEIKPTFNPMIGPSPYILINMGARYAPCMHNVTGVEDSTLTIAWPCPNSTTLLSTDSSNQCTLAQLCGFDGFVGTPNQWYRFVLPIFLHAGIVHIGFNMLLQLTMGREMEKAIGPIRFFLVYMSSGIFGFVLGGNYAANGIASTGASGALFGVIALTLLDLLYTWKERRSPWKDLSFILLDVVISFALGLLPGLDNFSHIGGFLMGLVLGICILHSPAALRKRIYEPPYVPISQVKASDGDEPDSGITGFIRAPIGFFKGRKSAWWAWWFIRAVALAAVVIVFILLMNNFYNYKGVYTNTCSWCKYLSCININNWCTIGNLQITNTTSKRSVFHNWEGITKLPQVFSA